MGNQHMDRDKKPQAPQGGGERKNNEEVGEPLQLPDDKSKGGQPQAPRPGMGKPEGEQHGGQHDKGGQHGGQRPNAK